MNDASLQLSESEVRNLLAPFEGQIRDVFRLAFQRFNETHGPLRYEYSPGTVANILRDLIVAQARKSFDSVPGTGFITVRRMLIFHIRGFVVCRFKMLDRLKQPKNVPTSQSRAFRFQDEIPGFPPRAVKMNIGYIWNRLRTGYAELWITDRKSVV